MTSIDVVRLYEIKRRMNVEHDGRKVEESYSFGNPCCLTCLISMHSLTLTL